MPTHLSAAINIAKNMQDIDEICSKSPTNCLPALNEKLKNIHIKSRVWYDLMQYKFEALFALQKIKELHQTTKGWINQKDLPIPFKISLFIYYAKSLEEDKTYNETQRIQASKKYMGKAENLLELMNTVYPNPNLLIQLANLKMYAGEYKKAYQLLQSLILKYDKYADLVFKVDLYGNLGHLADRLGYKNKAIEYWLTSLNWVKKLGNDQQTATIYLNLANSQTTNQNFNDAKDNALHAIHHATLANDVVKQAQAQLLAVQLFLNLEQKVSAKKLLNSIKIEILSSEMLKVFTRLKNQV
jgi:tetratricopeptide (TPR) repeat protein